MSGGERRFEGERHAVAFLADRLASLRLLASCWSLGARSRFNPIRVRVT
ncbi:hypothetical protein ACFPRL_05040 [Pseudoclavibacter helvolus]